jgi:tetratricopeptide (TPR) repeat protein
MIGLVSGDRGDLVTARRALEHSLVLAAADPDVASGIAARNALALVASADGHPREAIRHLEQALDISRRIGARHLEAAVENNLADQLHALGEADASMDHLRRAVALFAEVGGRPAEPEPEIWKLVDW